MQQENDSNKDLGNWAQNMTLKVAGMPKLSEGNDKDSDGHPNRLKLFVRGDLAPGTLIVSSDVYDRVRFGNLLGHNYKWQG